MSPPPFIPPPKKHASQINFKTKRTISASHVSAHVSAIKSTTISPILGVCQQNTE
jgi:hypothetical protein